MVTLVWAESVAMLGIGGFALLTGIISIFWLLKIKRDYDKRANPRYDDGPPLHTWIALAILAPSAIALPFTILYPWNWVGAFAPEARLIARLLGTLTQTSS